MGQGVEFFTRKDRADRGYCYRVQDEIGVCDFHSIPLTGKGTCKELAGGGGSQDPNRCTMVSYRGERQNRGKISFRIVLIGSKQASSKTSGPYKWNSLMRFISLLMNVSEIHTYRDKNKGKSKDC